MLARMARRAPLFYVLALASSVAGLACKSDPDPGAVFIGRYCDIYQPCCTAAGLPGDGKACRAVFATGSSPMAKYDATAGDACIAGLMQIAGQPGFCSGDIVPPSACAEAFGGATGLACIQDGDCPTSGQGDVKCVSGFVNGTNVNKCQVQVRGAAGSTPCIGDVRGGIATYTGTPTGDIPDQGYLCSADDGLRCDSGACVALTADGADCMHSTDCVGGDFCDLGTGKCAPRHPTGAACVGAAMECVDGATCDETAGQCVAQKDVGAACTMNPECLTGNCLNGACAVTPTGGPNVLCAAAG